MKLLEISKSELETLRQMPEIYALMYFGSVARGDSDVYSDCDIFAVCASVTREELLGIKSKLANEIDEKANVSVYTMEDLLVMAQKGSLFLWHLKLEGKKIFSKCNILNNLFANLKSYGNHEKDILLYRSLLADVKHYFKKYKKLTEFDLYVLFTLVRDTCILICDYEGKPKFGRYSAYYSAIDTTKNAFPINENLYHKLCNWKLWYDRGVKPKEFPNHSFDEDSVIEKIDMLLDLATAKCK